MTVCTTGYNLDDVTDSLAIVAVPCMYNDDLRGKGGQLTQSLASQMDKVAVEATVPAPCRLLFHDRRTQYKHYLTNSDSGTDSQATVPLPCRNNGGRGGKGGQLSLSLAGIMEAIKAGGGNCLCIYNRRHNLFMTESPLLRDRRTQDIH